MIHKLLLSLFLILASAASSTACDGSIIDLVGQPTDNGNGTFTITVKVCLALDVNWGATIDFDLLPSGGTYTSISSIQSSAYNSSYQYCAAGCATCWMCAGCADSSLPVTVAGLGTLAISMGTLTVTGGSVPGQYLAPDDLSTFCISQSVESCDNITFTTNGYPSQITFSGTEEDACGPTSPTCETDFGIADCCTDTMGGGCLEVLPLPSITCLIFYTTISPTCGGANGQASVTTSNCTAPYTYLWNDSQAQTTSTATGLTAGLYTVTVIDSVGFINQTVIAVSDSTSPTFGISSTDIACKGGGDGMASLFNLSGTTPFTYSWGNTMGQTTVAATGLSGGTYPITVIDSNGCMAINTAYIFEPSQTLVVSLTGTNTTCGSAGGNVSATVSGGVPSYTYLWDDPGASTFSTVDSLIAGTYHVTVTDSAGCIKMDNIIISNGSGLAISVDSVVNNNCFGEENGLISTSILAGTAPFTYSWSNGDSTSAINVLAAGTYSVTVTDSTGCSAANSATISEPAAIVTNDTVTICDNDSILLEGAYQNTAGIYSDTLNSSSGCDSIATNTLVVLTSYSTAEADVSICNGDSALVYGTYRSQAGTYYDSLSSGGGCDSVLSTSIVVNPLPVVSFTGLQVTYCMDGPVDTLTGIPPGGTFIGAGISDSILDPISQYYPSPGTYSITYSYTDSLGCTDSSEQSFFVAICAGVDDLNFIQRLKLYPNPNHGKVTIDLGALYGLITLEVHNLSGALILHETITKTKLIHLDIEGAAGEYLISLTADGYQADLVVVKK